MRGGGRGGGGMMGATVGLWVWMGGEIDVGMLSLDTGPRWVGNDSLRCVLGEEPRTASDSYERQGQR